MTTDANADRDDAPDAAHPQAPLTPDLPPLVEVPDPEVPGDEGPRTRPGDQDVEPGAGLVEPPD